MTRKKRQLLRILIGIALALFIAVTGLIIYAVASGNSQRIYNDAILVFNIEGRQKGG